MDELLQLEHAGWASLHDGTAGTFYGSLMTDDAVMVLANGEVMSRSDVVASLSDAPPWDSYAIDDPRLVVIDESTTALVYTGTGRREGDPPFVAVMTSIYVRRGGTWALALYQQTPKP